MKVELSIKDDAELRNYIKYMIRGQVRGLIRAEIKTIVREAVQSSIESRAQNELRNAIKDCMNEYDFRKDLREMATDKVDKCATDALELRIVSKSIELVDKKIDNKVLEYVGEKIAEVPINVTIGKD